MIIIAFSLIFRDFFIDHKYLEPIPTLIIVFIADEEMLITSEDLSDSEDPNVWTSRFHEVFVMNSKVLHIGIRRET